MMPVADPKCAGLDKGRRRIPNLLVNYRRQAQTEIASRARNHACPSVDSGRVRERRCNFADAELRGTRSDQLDTCVTIHLRTFLPNRGGATVSLKLAICTR
jgi:hypothetical protein